MAILNPQVDASSNKGVNVLCMLMEEHWFFLLDCDRSHWL